MTRRRVDLLRRLAASTPFPGEREAALRKAAELERALVAEVQAETFEREGRFPTFSQAMQTSMNRDLAHKAVAAAEEAVNAIPWTEGKWAMMEDGDIVLLSLDELLERYARLAA